MFTFNDEAAFQTLNPIKNDTSGESCVSQSATNLSH